NGLLILYKLIWSKLPFFLPTISRAAYYHYKYFPKNVMEKYDIKLMVFPEHNLFYFTQLLAELGRKKNIPSIIVPFTIANTIEWSEAFYKEPSRSLSKLHNRLVAFAFPNWIHYYKNKLLLLPIEIVLLHEMFGITPKKPWLLNSGNIDFLALESNAMKEYYVSSGIEEKYLRATGALYNDELFLKLQNADTYRAKLYSSLNLESHKPMILCALPPNQCDGRLDIMEFSDYAEIVRYLLTQLSNYSNKCNVVINLHPRIKPSSIEFIKEYPVKVFYGDIAEIIPLSSIYVAICSATIRMAISCGIPVINYDLYQYRYDDYTGLNGVITVFQCSEFSAILDKLVNEGNFYGQVKKAQHKDSGKWGELDGKAGQNLLNEINMLFT
ncbi:TPA: hypothetical protein JBJ80_15380, partial [Legionella pneumophila]|nr:hypothetical protein [Legionella pneumophila]